MGARIAPNGVWVWHSTGCDTLWVDTELSAGERLNTKLGTLTLRTTVKPLWQADTVIATNLKKVSFRKQSTKLVSQCFVIKDGIKRWQPDSPYLYVVNSSLFFEDFSGQRSGVDRQRTEFGFVDSLYRVDRVVCEDETYEGYGKGNLPVGEIDSRVLSINAKGYDAVSDTDHANHPRFVRDGAVLGLYYYVLLDSGNGRMLTDQDIERMVKERRNSPSVRAWKLPDCVAEELEHYRQLIAALDPRPVYLQGDVRLPRADRPLTEPSLTDAEAMPDSDYAAAPASILRGMTGMQYVYRINCGGPSMMDSNQQLWEADTCWLSYRKGEIKGPLTYLCQGNDVAILPDDDSILRSYRMCNTADSMKLVLPVDSFCSYCIEAYMVEPTFTRSGGRQFQMSVNGSCSRLIDINRMIGKRNRVLNLSFTYYTDRKTNLVIAFPKPYAGHAIISAIAISKNQK